MTSPLDHFDRIVCINLDERPDRWQQMQATVGPHLGRIELERFSAMKPGLARQAVHNARAGCLLSHRRVIQAAYRDGLESVLVLEDDVCFDPRFADLAARSIATLDATQWDLFYLGLTPTAPLLPAGPGLVRTFGGNTTHAIAYHRRAMPGLLKRLPEEQGVLRFLSRYKAIDLYYARHAMPRLRCYSARPQLAFQHDDFSDIQQQQAASNEQASRIAFDRHLVEYATPAHRQRIMVGLALRRLGYEADGLRRRLLRPVKAK